MRALADLPHHDAAEGPDLAGILRAAVQGDARAWEQVLQRYASRVYALAKSRCRQADLAEEITQSVFATVAAKLGSGEYLEQGRFEAWLFRIAMNRIRDEMRRRKRQAEPTDPGVMPEKAQERAAPLADADELEALRRALASLSDRDREIIELRHHAAMSFKQMADLLGEPMGTLLARHHRALAKIRRQIESQTDPDDTATSSTPRRSAVRRDPE